jgi:hypothetical protein
MPNLRGKSLGNFIELNNQGKGILIESIGNVSDRGLAEANNACLI